VARGTEANICGATIQYGCQPNEKLGIQKWEKKRNGSRELKGGTAAMP